MKNKIGFFFFSGIISLMVSCASNRPVGVPEKELAFHDLLSVFAEREKEFRSIKGMVAVSLYPARGTAQKINGILSFDQDEKVRFQGFDPLGRTLIDLTAVSDLYRLKLSGSPPLRGTLKESRSLPVRVSPAGYDLIFWERWLKILKEIRQGGNPAAGKNEVLIMTREGEEVSFSVIEIDGKAGAVAKKIWLETRHYKPVREEIYLESAPEERVLAGSIHFEYKNRGEKNAWPDKIEAKLPDGDLHIEFLEMSFSPEFTPDFFNLDESQQ